MINELNARKHQDPITKRFVPRTDPLLPFLDVNGDGFAFPIDALLVINELNRGGPGGGEGEGATAPTSEEIPSSHRYAFAEGIWMDDLVYGQSSQERNFLRGRNRR